MRRGDLSDFELLGGVRREPALFAVFYDRYETAIVGYFMRRTRDPELTADLTAEVFAAALGGASRFRAQGPDAVGWLFTIAERTLARSVRRGKVEARARERLGIREAFELGPGQADALQSVVAGDEWVRDLLAGLPDEQRAAIEARVLQDLPYEEIASRLMTSELVVRKRVSRGLASLRDRLEESS